MISLIIPYNNTYKDVKTVINSIKNISNKLDIEYIFIGHSFDNDADDRIKELTRHSDDKRIVNIKNGENERISSLMNTGIRQAKGEYITFITPGNDIFVSDFEKMVNFINSKEKEADMYISSFLTFDKLLGVPTPSKHFFTDRINVAKYIEKDEIFKLSCLSERTWIKKDIAMKCMFNENTFLFDFSTMPLWTSMADKIYFMPFSTYKMLSNTREGAFAQDEIGFLFLQSVSALQYLIDYSKRHFQRIKDLSHAIYVSNQITEHFVKLELKGQCPRGYVNKMVKLTTKLEKLQGKEKYYWVSYDSFKHYWKLNTLFVVRPFLRLMYYFKKDAKNGLFISE